jgi:hypothetical protein
LGGERRPPDRIRACALPGGRKDQHAARLHHTVVRTTTMEKSRVQAYLQSACSVLNFDIGEIWVCRDVANQGACVPAGRVLVVIGFVIGGKGRGGLDSIDRPLIPLTNHTINRSSTNQPTNRPSESTTHTHTSRRRPRGAQAEQGPALHPALHLPRVRAVPAEARAAQRRAGQGDGHGEAPVFALGAWGVRKRFVSDAVVGVGSSWTGAQNDDPSIDPPITHPPTDLRGRAGVGAGGVGTHAPRGRAAGAERLAAADGSGGAHLLDRVRALCVCQCPTALLGGGPTNGSIDADIPKPRRSTLKTHTSRINPTSHNPPTSTASTCASSSCSPPRYWS